MTLKIPLTNVEVANQFATFLDQDDFIGASGLISADCIYESPDGRIIGAENIVASYREHSKRAHDLFDSVTYESSVKALNQNQFEMTYTDIISKNGKTHRYSCKQIVEIKDQLVVAIRHEEIPAEYEKIKIFYKEIGI